MISMLLCLCIPTDIQPHQLEQGTFAGKKTFRTINDQPVAGIAHADDSGMAAYFLSILNKKFTMTTTGIPQALAPFVTGFFQEGTGLVVNYRDIRVYLHGVKNLTVDLTKHLDECAKN